jgi:hypothetical protein
MEQPKYFSALLLIWSAKVYYNSWAQFTVIAFDNGIREEKLHIISVICFKNTDCQLYLRTLLLCLLSGSGIIFLRIRNLTCNKTTISEGCYIRDLTDSNQEQHTSFTES